MGSRIRFFKEFKEAQMRAATSNEHYEATARLIAKKAEPANEMARPYCPFFLLSFLVLIMKRGLEDLPLSEDDN